MKPSSPLCPMVRILQWLTDRHRSKHYGSETVVSDSSDATLHNGPSNEDFFQSNASNNPGNSRDTLTDSKGEAFGINTPVRAATGGTARIGFAVPRERTIAAMVQRVPVGEVRKSRDQILSALFFDHRPKTLTKKFDDLAILQAAVSFLFQAWRREYERPPQVFLNSNSPAGQMTLTVWM